MTSQFGLSKYIIFVVSAKQKAPHTDHFVRRPSVRLSVTFCFCWHHMRYAACLNLYPFDCTTFCELTMEKQLAKIVYPLDLVTTNYVSHG